MATARLLPPLLGLRECAVDVGFEWTEGVVVLSGAGVVFDAEGGRDKEGVRGREAVATLAARGVA